MSSIRIPVFGGLLTVNRNCLVRVSSRVTRTVEKGRAKQRQETLRFGGCEESCRGQVVSPPHAAAELWVLA